MPKIGSRPQPVASAQVSAKPATAQKKAEATGSQSTQKAGWTPGAGGKAKPPAVAPEITELVGAYKKAEKAMSQMDMVAGSVEINNAADKLLKRVATELATQYDDRDLGTSAEQVVLEMEKFFRDVGPARGYRMDPERGTMASLEDNGARMDKVLGKLKEMTERLHAVNKEPNGDHQQALNRSAFGESVEQQGRFALAFDKAYHGGNGDKALASASAFLKALPGKIDAGIESRGGSLEPLERAGGTASALEEFSKKLAASK